MNDLPPIEAYESEPRVNGLGGTKEEPPKPKRCPISWDSLEGRAPPEREWIIPHWIPHRHTTLLAGRGGIGKTLIAQHIATALAVGHEYIEPLEPRRVLMWAGEDDEAELWRRQVQISSWMGQPLSVLTERFYLHSYAGSDITLMAPVFGALTPTPMLSELREQVADYRAEVVILDNIARLFGGSENDRHAVTTFCAVVQGTCAPAAVLLLGHPAKAAGSELGHGIVIFPGGAGTAEEILYLLGILLDPANRDLPFPVVFSGPADSAEYFEQIHRFIGSTLGPAAQARYQMIIGDPAAVARAMVQGLSQVREFRKQASDSYGFNWLLKIPLDFQLPFEVTHAAMRNLRLSRDQPVHERAANLRRAFSGIVAGNIKEYGINAIERHGPFELAGEPSIMEPLDRLLRSFVAQGRMKFTGTEYTPCYRLVA